ncbi:MAG TPA: PAS domain S-box protein, partial [Coleofasciculaceae cyanobacterium]
TEQNARLQQEIRVRQQAEEQLQLLERAIAASNNGIIITDLQQPDNPVIYANSGFERITGYKREDVIGKNCRFLQGTDTTQPALDALRYAIVSGQEGQFILRNYRQDGTLFWNELGLTPVQDETGHLTNFIGVLTDITERKEAEEKLRESEAQLAKAQRVAHVGNWEFDVLTQEVSWSEELFRIFGLDPNQPQPTFDEHLEQIHPDNRAFWQKIVGQALADGKPYQCDLQIVRPDGQIRHVEARGEAVVNQQGQVIKLLGTILDITDRKQAEDAQRASDRRLHYLVSSSPSIIFSAKPSEDYGTTYVTENVANLLGYEAQEFLEDSHFWANHIHPDDVERIFTGLANISEQDVYSHEYRFRRADGTYCWLFAQLRLMQDEAGKPIEILGYLIDISDRKQTEATLQEAERRWRSLLENVQLVVVGLSPQGNIEYVNPFFLSLTGYAQQEVLGKNWFEHFIPLSAVEQIKMVFQEVLEDKVHTYHQNPILTKSGEERLIAWNNTLLRDTEGNIIGTTSIGEDITQRQAIERMKKEFISIVSHELRTPLTAIRGSLGLLTTGIYDNKPAKAKHMLEIARTNSERLVRLVNEILDLERLDSGKVALVKEVCDVATLLQRSIEAVQGLADSAAIALCVSPISAQVWAAPDSIIQTLTNLLSNAIKFSPANTTITLSTQLHSNYVLFQVKDQGRGIPVDRLETIFERFQQVDASDSRSKGGTGLGLAICRSIVQQHDGRIWAESIVGEGSTFYFTLPLHQP